MNESNLLNLIRLESSRKNILTWRNNVGAAFSKTGSFIRFGLGNESALVNSQLKSSDLIGIKPVVITQDMVGKTIGQFVSFEVKKPKWVYSETHREKAQFNWIELINKYGGYAKFITAIEEI